ncbi:YqaJ viral recombinase family nuclease [Clostridium sp. C105KSO13]|uniref:YqaJ viral recombinase family nuclease n=1 Tax=Clostridium sp. C105KSO13 TaxID=1776045 RepID=UPI0007407C13|nr:YqaJ viral recombinase family protein [Clostridium sp. C105KSO13]CUX24336.1 YqaJ-like viral recombinase domain protein [Clostridium sp. C105KSO13]
MNNSAVAMKPYEPEIVVDIENLTREEWLKYRRKGIGGSDVAAIMGISPFATIRDLYNDKVGIQPLMEDEEESNWVAKAVGQRLEDLVAEIFSKKTGLEVFPVRKMFRHPLYPFMLADVDFFIRFPDGSFGILECKTCNYNARDKWADDAIPANYVYQVRHYMAVTNISKAYIACLYGNNENEFVIRSLERDMMEEEEIIEQEAYFWNEHVTKEVAPPYTGKPDLILASIRRYSGYADKSLPEITISNLETIRLEKYLNLSEEKSQIEKRKKEIEAEQRALSVPFVEMLGQGCKAVLEDGSSRYRITYNPTKRTQIGKDRMEKLKIQYPDIYEEYTKTTESRTFRVKKEAA